MSTVLAEIVIIVIIGISVVATYQGYINEDTITGKTFIFIVITGFVASILQIIFSHKDLKLFFIGKNNTQEDPVGLITTVSTNSIKISNIPFLKNEYFTGRDEFLSDIRIDLNAGKIVALTGIGGVGKSHLVLEYIYRHLEEYRLVWWIRAEESATIYSDYVDLAVKLGIISKNITDFNIILSAINLWLINNSDWLLIFDNAEDQAKIDKYIPRGGLGHIIITSRNQDWSYAKVFRVLPFKHDESINFLRNRTEQNDEEALLKIADELGYLPLALEQAGAYIKESRRPISDYIKLLHINPIMILEKGNPTDYDKSIATVWSISINSIQSERPIVVDFINLLSFFAPENIPKFLFIDELEAFPEYLASPIKNNDQLYDAISILARYSLISTNKDSIWIHRLVQATIRNNLKEKDKKRWARTAATLVKSVFYYDRENMQSWDKCALLLPHAQATARYAIEFDVALVEASDLFNQISGYLLARAEVSEAKIASESAIKIGERIHGPNNPKFADYLYNYGRVLRVNNLEEAKKVFERALNIDQNYLDADKAKVARDLCSIGSVQLEQGDVKGCNKSFETALAIDEIVTGIKNSKTISEVSADLQSNNELADAKNLFDRALRVSEKLSDKSLLLNTEQAKMVIRINNIGKLMYNERYLIEAKILFEKAIEIGEKNLGYEHPNIALRINNLGRVLLDQGDTDGAQKAFEKAFSIGQKVLGMNHPYVAIYLNNLGAVEYKDSELERAEELFKRAIKINENILGIDNPYLAIYIKNLSKVLEERGDYKSAKELYERASRIEENQKIDYWASKAVILDMPNTIGLVPGKLYEAQEKAKSNNMRQNSKFL